MHYLLLVIDTKGRKLGDIMEPFSDYFEVDEYCDGEVSEYAKKKCLDYYNKERDENGLSNYSSFEECYKENGSDWNSNGYRKDNDGVWRAYTTCNPDAKYDWYEVGGRWAGRLRLKDGVENKFGVSFSWGWPLSEREKFLAEYPNNTDIARKGDIDNINELNVCSVLVDDEWYDEIADEGKTAKDYLDMVDDNAMVYFVDYHM